MVIFILNESVSIIEDSEEALQVGPKVGIVNSEFN
jgi:hypothetical protein